MREYQSGSTATGATTHDQPENGGGTDRHTERATPDDTGARITSYTSQFDDIAARTVSRGAW